MNKSIVVKADTLGKKYSLGKQANQLSLRELFNPFKLGFSGKKSVDFWALKNVSFEIKKADVVGIIGKNGAGKSTLLKVLSRITLPTEGKGIIRGRVASLLEVGTGFSAELTGRENIYLNGAILVIKRSEIKLKLEEIIDFSGVERFIDTPVKRYSSGMYVRLAFAVAAHLESDLLLVDEVLSVGDLEFQKKCIGKMNDVSRSGRTIIFVSHNLGSIRKLCNKGLVMENGQNSELMSVNKAIDLYLSSQLLSENEVVEKVLVKNNTMEFFDIHINQLSTGKNVDIFAGEPITVKMNYRAEKYPFSLVVSLGLRRHLDGNLAVHVTNELADVKHQTSAGGALTAKLDVPHLAPGLYSLEMEAWLDSKLVMSTTPIGSLHISAMPFFDNRITYPNFPSSILVNSKWQFGTLK